jgi:hypothetical protein
MPAFDEPRAFYGGQPIGRLYVDLAKQAPPRYISPYSTLAGAKIVEVYLAAAQRYQKKGEEGLNDFILSELKDKAEYVRKVMRRNVFLNVDEEASE